VTLTFPRRFRFQNQRRFLHQALSAALRQSHISTESVIVIEFFPAFCPPSEIDQQTANAWMSSVRFFTEGLPSSLSDGTVRIDDNGGDCAYRHADQMRCAYRPSQLIARDLDGIVRARASVITGVRMLRCNFGRLRTKGALFQGFTAIRAPFSVCDGQDDTDM
jgi:hypothetical protein